MKHLWDEVMYCFFRYIVQINIGLMYFKAGAEGLKLQVPSIFGTKVSQLPLPFIGILEDFEGTRDLEFSHLTALTIFIVVAYAIELCMTLYVEREGFDHIPPSLDPGKCLNVAVSVVALVFSDAVLFYFGINAHSVFGGANQSAVLMTILYLSLTVVTCFILVYLKNRMK